MRLGHPVGARIGEGARVASCPEALDLAADEHAVGVGEVGHGGALREAPTSTNVELHGGVAAVALEHRDDLGGAQRR